MKLVSRQINEALAANTSAPMNFGLLFNKYLDYEREGREDWVPKAKKDKATLIGLYERSNKETNNLLQTTHLRQYNYCRQMKSNGWHYFVVEAELSSPFVSGLGMSHPTETGLVLDHTSGVPYIPAAGQKGVMRLAHMINSMKDEDGNWKELEQLYEQDIIKDENKDGEKITCWQEDGSSKTLYGYSGKKDSLAGQLIILDAYPLEPPTLKEEIINPHFMKYYGGSRGPTEDQSPVPVKFLAVSPGVKFVFRFLLRKSLNNALEKNQNRLIDLVQKAVQYALTKEGVGAKTSLGFGRFTDLKEAEPEKVKGWLRIVDEEKEATNFPWRAVVREIKAVKEWNWGMFLQNIINNDEAKKYQQEQEIGIAARSLAEKVRRENPKKWTEERDKTTREWLAESGVTWRSNNNKSQGSPIDISPKIQQELNTIYSLKDWGSYQQAKLEVENLSKQALRALAQRMKKEWGCSGKKAKKEKKSALHKINKLVKN